MMKIELLGAIDYEKLKVLLADKTENKEEIISLIEELEKERKTQIISAAGALSRFPGNIFEILELKGEKSLEQNSNFIKRVIKMGHDSITDHDYLVFAVQNASILIEQTVIAERYSSFTIKSRREVDFSKVGFYIPDFYDDNRVSIFNNEKVKKEYIDYMNSLFNQYNIFKNSGMELEDARFILPYCYHSNFFMGVDAHTLKDLIIKLTKTKYANIQELKEFGEYLYHIAKEKIPYIIESIDDYKEKTYSPVESYLEKKLEKEEYKILDKVQLINHTKNIDDHILITALMRRYQYNYQQAKKIYEKACIEYPNFKEELMRTIAFEDDALELSQVNFSFQLPISYAVLTHLTRHRNHQILTPDFAPNIDLSQYKTPPKIKGEQERNYKKVFEQNQKMYNHFKYDYNIREEDLVYFTLSGNMVNVITNIDGKNLKHILALRECNKAQWEIRELAKNMHKEVASLENAKLFQSILGPSCETEGICKEKKECCGKIYTLKGRVL